MRHARFDPELAKKLLGQFFAEPRQPGERFWTTREIMQRFGVSLYAANTAVRALVQQGILERRRPVGTFVTATGMAPLKAEAQPHVGAVLNAWVAAATQNPWATELRTALATECQRRAWKISLFQEPGHWTDPLFPTRFSAAGCNRLVMVFPGEPVGFMALTNLHQAAIPIVSIGHMPPAFESLKIPVVDGDDEEAMRRLVLQLRREGHRRLLVVGFLNPMWGLDRVRGCVNAFEQFAHEYPSDTFVESPDPDYLAATVKKRLSGRTPVEAIIFQNHLAFLTAWERVPLLQEKLHAGLAVAVLNEYYLRQRFPAEPLIEATFNPHILVKRALDVLDARARGERSYKLTLLPYDIVWPTKSE